MKIIRITLGIYSFPLILIAVIIAMLFMSINELKYKMDSFNLNENQKWHASFVIALLSTVIYKLIGLF